MLARAFLNPILFDERLTAALGDAEACLLVNFLVDQAERLDGLQPEEAVWKAIAHLCQRGRVLGRVVQLWHDQQCLAATQLAASEGLAEALPSRRLDSCRLLERMIALESLRCAA
ncbi:MAG: hypothetical protein SNJ75_10665 [Gemmataceae bacterium]